MENNIAYVYVIIVSLELLCACAVQTCIYIYIRYQYVQALLNVLIPMLASMELQRIDSIFAALYISISNVDIISAHTVAVAYIMLIVASLLILLHISLHLYI